MKRAILVIFYFIISMNSFSQTMENPYYIERTTLGFHLGDTKENVVKYIENTLFRISVDMDSILIIDAILLPTKLSCDTAYLFFHNDYLYEILLIHNDWDLNKTSFQYERTLDINEQWSELIEEINRIYGEPTSNKIIDNWYSSQRGSDIKRTMWSSLDDYYIVITEEEFPNQEDTGVRVSYTLAYIHLLLFCEYANKIPQL